MAGDTTTLQHEKQEIVSASFVSKGHDNAIRNTYLDALDH